jgi:hypothetical protein
MPGNKSSPEGACQRLGRPFRAGTNPAPAPGRCPGLAWGAPSTLRELPKLRIQDGGRMGNTSRNGMPIGFRAVSSAASKGRSKPAQGNAYRSRHLHRWRAPKGRPKLAQGNAYRSRHLRRWRAPKGRPKPAQGNAYRSRHLRRWRAPRGRPKLAQGNAYRSRHLRRWRAPRGRSKPAQGNAYRSRHL